jgi:SulP family sulfate permease
VAVVLTNIIEQEGVGTMFYAVMLAGILQMLFGIFRLGVVMRMVPHSVMVGFVNGLGLVIGLAQVRAYVNRRRISVKIIIVVAHTFLGFAVVF